MGGESSNGGPPWRVFELSGKLLASVGCMDELIFAVEEAPEGGYTARGLGYSIFTEADSIPQLHDMVRDAVHCYFDEGKAPKIIRLHFVRDEVIAI